MTVSISKKGFATVGRDKRNDAVARATIVFFWWHTLEMVMDVWRADEHMSFNDTRQVHVTERREKRKVLNGS